MISILQNIVYTLLNKLILTFLLCTLFVQTSYSQLVFNEIMHSNIDCVYDDGILPESWIEVYNPTDEIINTADYRLGTTKFYDEASKIFRIYGIFPLCYITITCDKDFGNALVKLDSDGGFLYLFNGNGDIVDSLAYKKMKKPNVSWGKDPTSGEWGTMLRSTPGMLNSAIANKFPSNVQFSVEGGVWEHFEPFYVELTADSVPDYHSDSYDVDSSLCIRYTLDGSEPNDASTIYTHPILVDSTTFIRAKVFDSTKPLLTSNAVSYIYHGRPVDKNVVSIITDSVYYYGEEYGIMGNRRFAEYGTRRSMNFEYFPLDKNHAPVNTICKGRAGGNTSRIIDPYLNLVLYAKKNYGDKHFKTEFWPHLKPNVNENKSIYLRCGDKGQSLLRDILSMNIAPYLDIDYQATDVLSVYLNGKYYGALNMYERSNEDYLWANYNKLDNFDLVSIEGSQNLDVKAGSLDDFYKFIEFWDSDASSSLKEWQKWIDVENYTNLMSLEFFGANYDFWYNNTRMYKTHGDSSSVWKFIAVDLDLTFTDFFDHSYFEYALTDDSLGIHKSDDYGSQLWRCILKCDEYKNYFLNRIIAYHGDFLNKRLYTACLDSIYKLAQKEISLTRNIYFGGDDNDFNYQFLRDLVSIRSDYFHTDLQTFFKLGQAVNVKVNNLEDKKLDLYYNDIKLKTGSFDGWDFAGRTLTIQAKNDDNIETLNWIVRKSTGDKVETELYTNTSLLTYVIPNEVDSIVFTPTNNDFFNANENTESLTDIEILESEGAIIIWDIYGREIYSIDKKQKLVLPKNVPLIISANGCIKKVMF